MSTPEPTSDAEPKRRTRRKTQSAEAAPDLAAETAPKPRRKRKTKAEKEAERMAKMAEDAAKPIDPRIWMGFGGLLLIVGLCIYLDPIGFEQAGASNNEPWIKTILVLALAFFGKNPVTAVLGVIGGLSLIWGIRGWLRERFGANKEAPVS